jgi:ABC-type glycerol-3-phosphate transport system substrate-binding protein
MLYYNPKLFQDAGVPLPKEDWTMDQFLDAAKKINAKNKDVLGYGWTNQTFPGLNAWFMLNDTNLFQETRAPGGDWLWNAFYPGNKVAAEQGGGYLWGDSWANKEKNVETFQTLVDLIHRDKLSPVPTSNWDDLINLFAAKKIGMIMGHRFMIARFKNAGLTPDDFDVTFHPKWKTQRHQHGVSGWAIAKDAKSPDAAWAMVKWITRKDENSAWIKGGVQTSARRSVTNAPDQNTPDLAPKNWQAYYNVLDKMDAGATPSPADAKEITTVLLKYVSLAAGKEMPVKDALDKLHGELTEIASRTKR